MTKLSGIVFAVGACLIVAAPAAAVVVFDDHFDGNTGGVPVGWFGIGDGSAVEAGTVVTLNDEFIIVTEADVDPDQTGATVLTTMIVGTTHHTHGGLIDFAQQDSHFWIKLWAADGRLEVKASNVVDGEQELDVGYVAGYSGGAIELTLVLEAATFTVSTDAPAYSSGPIAYADVFPSFTRADLGHATRLVLENECPVPEPPCWSSYDRLTMWVQEATPVEAVDWGTIKALYRR